MNDKIQFLVLGFLFFTSSLHAEVKPNGLFCDHAVLQQGMEVPVWGTAREGEKVSVEFNGQNVSTTAKEGQWMVRLKNLKAGGPYIMKITGDNSITLNDLLVGEVWLCSGQSNMDRPMGTLHLPKPMIDKYAEEVAAANYPEIRHFLTPRKQADTPQREVSSKWEACSPVTVPKFTAVGYFFGSELQKTLKVPVGLINSARGGTSAQAWTSRETLEKECAPVLEAHQKRISDYAEALRKYKEKEPDLLAQWQKESEAAKQAGKPEPIKPIPPLDPNAIPPSCLYNAMIAPLMPYAIRGVIWYQGEANKGQAKLYRSLFPAMISNWRQAWGQGAFPFLFVQIAPFRSMPPELREAQLLTWKSTPNTSMVVTVDVGDAEDIHPTHKRPVGERLSLAARALAYGEKLEYSGPLFNSMVIQGSQALLSFTHGGSGLMAKEGELKGFVIAGDDKKFVPAKAEIKGENVMVSSEAVLKPVAVRYGWENVPDVNLYNKEGLPASPFRTDVED